MQLASQLDIYVSNRFEFHLYSKILRKYEISQKAFKKNITH